MPRKGLLGVLVVVCVLVVADMGGAQTGHDPSRDVFLETIGMLAGQGLVLGHENLGGIFVRYEKKLLSRQDAERALADQARYADWVLASFRGKLMGRLSGPEKKDLALLIGFYDVERQAIEALATYVRTGGSKDRQDFLSLQERVAAVIRQITLGAATP